MIGCLDDSEIGSNENVASHCSTRADFQWESSRERKRTWKGIINPFQKKKKKPNEFETNLLTISHQPRNQKNDNTEAVAIQISAS